MVQSNFILASEDTVCSEWWNLQHGASVEIKYKNVSFDTHPDKLQDLQAFQFLSKNFQGTEAEEKGQVHHAGPDILGVEGFLPENSNQEKQPRIEVPPRSVAPDDRNLFNFESALGFEKQDSTDVASELSGAKGPSTSMTQQMTGIGTDGTESGELHLSTRDTSQQSQENSYLTGGWNYLKASMFNVIASNVNNVEKVRTVLNNFALRFFLNSILPEPKTPVPENVHDEFDGILLKALFGQRKGPAVIELIKLIVDNVQNVEGTEKYKVNTFCMLMSMKTVMKSFKRSSTSGSRSTRRSNSDVSQRRLTRSNSLTGSISRGSNGGSNGGSKRDTKGSFNWSSSGSIKKSLDRSLSQSRSRSHVWDPNEKTDEEEDVDSASVGCMKPGILDFQRIFGTGGPFAGFSDGYGGIFLRLASNHSKATLYANTVKAVVKNVTVQREKVGKKEVKHYHIDFLGFATSPGIEKLTDAIPGVFGDIIRRIKLQEAIISRQT